MYISYDLLIAFLQSMVLITYFCACGLFYVWYKELTYKMMEGQDNHLERLPLPWWMRLVLVVGALISPIFLVFVLVSIF